MTALTSPLDGGWRRYAVRLLTRSDLASSFGAIVIALLVGAVLILAAGADVVTAYRTLWTGAFGSPQNVANTLVETVPLALVGVGVALSFRAGLFNIGAEGQLLLGGVAAALAGLALGGAPMPVVLPAMMAAGILAGAAWASVAALLRVHLGTNEVLSTIMLNYIAVFLVDYLLNGPARDPASPLARTAALPPSAILPVLVPHTTLHAGILVAVAAAAIGQLYLSRHVWGLRLAATGLNPAAARNAGLPVRRILLSTLAVSGALAGLAGMCQVSGVQGRMITNLSPGYGYTAIVVALLGRSSPAGTLVAALFFGALTVGGAAMETGVGVPASVVTIIQYLVVLLLVAHSALRLVRGAAPRAQEV
ncbi:ABC transporter permease [Micromonospora sp. CPCC 205371]|nr:ABC transporter permease [Micromonospora sp. CPCC 205371]